jgi:hypothetical protein
MHVRVSFASASLVLAVLVESPAPAPAAEPLDMNHSALRSTVSRHAA